MNNLNEFLIQQAKNKKVKGIYADGVTIHPYSQKALIKGGFKSCGIRIGMDPPRAFKGIDDKCAQRESMVLFYNKIVDQYAEVYAPVHHKSIIEEIYNNIGIEAKVNSPPSLEEDKSKLVQSDIEVDIRKSIDIASFYINTIGTNFKDEIKLRLRELCMKKIEVIDLHLDMCKKNLVRSVPDLEMLGFFFAGVLPNDRQQFLLLQYLNNLPIDYNKIVCYSEFAKKLKKYVQVCDPNSK